MQNYTGIGYRIRQRRLSLNLTLEELGEKCDLSQNFIGGIERGVDTPSVPTIVKIANALAVNMDYLFQDEITNPNSQEFDYYISQVINRMGEMNEDQKKCILQTVESYLTFSKF